MQSSAVVLIAAAVFAATAHAIVGGVTDPKQTVALVRADGDKTVATMVGTMMTVRDRGLTD